MATAQAGATQSEEAALPEPPEPAGDAEAEEESLPGGEQEFAEGAMNVDPSDPAAHLDFADDSGGVGEGLTDGTASEIKIHSFEELRLNQHTAVSAQEAWRTFIQSASSREAAGEAIYGALFESAPSLRPLFTTPRAVQAMRFMNGLNSFVMAIEDPPALKVLVETLGFGHLNLDVTVPRVVIFRDAILDLFQVELGARLTTMAYQGWKALLNYVGGAIIFIKANFAERLRVLDASWQIANDTTAAADKFSRSGDGAKQGAAAERQDVHKGQNKTTGNRAATDDEGPAEDGKSSMKSQNVPTTYVDMFRFNAAVMGFGERAWMQEVLACFDNIVTNVANSGRLQEECDVLVLRITKVATGEVKLSEYKSCMLASLRSLLPKDWSTSHEVAWSWLWENVERMLLKTMGSPAKWEKAYHKFYSSLDEHQAYEFRAQVYAKFFSLAPGGEDYFKQSNTYLHIIATKIMEMVLDMYREPVRMTDDISALGLRHVGYGIPTEFFGPFVTAVIEVLVSQCPDEIVVESARWSLGLIAKTLVRTILEGSTIVMKAINLNTKASINKAIACAPRGQRSQWMLMVAVGTQSISPLAWSIEGGKLEAAAAILKDLTTFRADRDRYYYGQDEMFIRHPDIVKKLCGEAPALLPTLLDGLIWRSRLTFNGQRRVNYYIKHLLVDQDLRFHKTLKWIQRLQDPKLMCHPLLVELIDLVWSRTAIWAFLFRKSWLFLTFVVFIFCQSMLERYERLPVDVHFAILFAGRCFIYCFNMGELIYRHTATFVRSYRADDFIRIRGIRCPRYLLNWQESTSFALMCCLLVLLATEPILYCMGHETENSDAGAGSGSGRLLVDGDGDIGNATSAASIDFVRFTEDCDPAQGVKRFPYSTFSMLSMFLYYVLLIDLAVLSTRFASYVLACGRMLFEVALFLVALFAAVLVFASALSCLDQTNEDFHGLHTGSIALWDLTMGLFSEERYDELREQGVVLLGAWTYLIGSVVFLINMLIAQLSCSYGSTYLDMIGYARLQRTRLIVDTMASISERRWTRFHTSLALDTKLEFNEGDVGLAGGIQVLEPASAHPTTVDMIQRFGGSTSPSVQWPVLEKVDEGADRFERLEKMLQKALARMTQRGSGGKHAESTTGSGRSGKGEENNSTGSNLEDAHSGGSAAASQASDLED